MRNDNILIFQNIGFKPFKVINIRITHPISIESTIRQGLNSSKWITACFISIS